MKFYYYSFNEYRKLDKRIKEKFTFLSTAYTSPGYWSGDEFKPFKPTDDLFHDACINFGESKFEERYKNQIYSLDKNEILKELKEMSNGKDIVFLVWEAENKSSERDIFIPWLMNCTIKDMRNFSFGLRLQEEKCNSILFEI